MTERGVAVGIFYVVLLTVLAVGCGKKETKLYPVVDTTPPVTLVAPPGGTYGTSVSVALTSNEAADVYCTTDGSTPTASNYAYCGPSPLSGIEVTTDTTLKFFAVDMAGNEEAVKIQTYVVSAGPDMTPPRTTAYPVGGTYDSGVSVTLTPDEPATVYYTTDGSTPDTSSEVYTSPINIMADTTLKFFAVDTAGNEESVKTEEYVIDTSVDTTPPVTTAAPAGGTYGSAVTVTFTSNEPATVYYTTDGREPTMSDYDGTGASPLSGIVISSDTTLKFFAVDMAGNEETTRTEEYTITGGGDTPAITSITPDSGPYGTEVTIDGSSFGATGTVTFFDGKEAKANSWSDTSIVCVVPPYSEPGEVTVTTIAGTSNGVYFNVDNGSHGTGGEMGPSTRNYWGYKWKKVGAYDYYIGVHQYYADHPEEPAPLMVFANTHEVGWQGAHLVAAVIGKQALSGAEQPYYPDNYDHPGIILYWSTSTEHVDTQWNDILGLVEEMKGLYNIDVARIYFHATCNKSGYFIGWVVYAVDVFWGYGTDSTYGPGSPHGDLGSRGNSPETWPAENKRMPCIFETNWTYAGGYGWQTRLCNNGWVKWNGTSEQGTSKKQWTGWITQDPHHEEGDIYVFSTGWERNQHYGVWEWHLHHRNPTPGELTKP